VSRLQARERAASRTPSLATTTPTALLERYFYFFMAFLVVVPVAYGFSFTVGQNLIHPSVPRPGILYLHAAVFTGWLVFFVLQTGLVRARKVQWHRRVGWLGLALGIMIVGLGVSTAVAMARFNALTLHQSDAASSLIVPLFDMLCFTSSFAPGIWWRKSPEWHRRLMLIATCVLTAAGFGRFPAWLLPPYLFYGGVDALILLGVARDLVVTRRVHPVYMIALPALLTGQIIVTYTALHAVPSWLRIAHAILGY
jgi:hypothetical protein